MTDSSAKGAPPVAPKPNPSATCEIEGAEGMRCVTCEGEGCFPNPDRENPYETADCPDCDGHGVRHGQVDHVGRTILPCVCNTLEQQTCVNHIPGGFKPIKQRVNRRPGARFR